MYVAVTTPPDPVVSWGEAKAHLRLDSDDDQTLVEAFIASATAWIDGPEGWLGRSIGRQTLRLTTSEFPTSPLSLPYGPVAADGVDAVTYLDADGAEQELDPAVFEVLSGGRIALRYGQSWPTTLANEDAVRIEYQAGYDELPAPLKAAILLTVGDLYANRETAVTGVTASTIPMTPTVGRLLAPFRVW